MLSGILRTFLTAVYLVGFFLFSLILWLRVKWMEFRGREEQATESVNQLATTWGQQVLGVTGSRVQVCGRENIPDEPVVIVSNHQGALDIPLLMGYVDKGMAFVAKEELQKIPILATWMRQIKCIMIDRSDIRQTLKAFGNAGDVFSDGQSLVIFPEGTRSKSSELGRFKRGSFKIPLQHEVPILPVTIKDSYQIWEGNDGLVQSAEVEVIISQPIYPEQLTEEEKDNIGERVRGIIEKNLES